MILACQIKNPDKDKRAAAYYALKREGADTVAIIEDVVHCTYVGYNRKQLQRFVAIVHKYDAEA